MMNRRNALVAGVAVLAGAAGVGGAQRVEHSLARHAQVRVEAGDDHGVGVRQRLHARLRDDLEARTRADRSHRGRADGEVVRRLRVIAEHLRGDREIERDDRVESEGDHTMRRHWQDRNGYWHSCHSPPARPRGTMLTMKIEILLFDGFDDLDAFGPFEVLNGAGIDTRFVTVAPQDRVRTAHGASVVPHGVLGDPDLVLVPGGGWHDRAGAGAYAEAKAGRIPHVLARRHATGRRVGSVCTGAMLLAEAGILQGRAAITHHSAIEDLRTYGADVRDGARVVEDGDIITAAGVTSGIDLALHLVARELGNEAAVAQAAEIEHRWEPISV